MPMLMAAYMYAVGSPTWMLALPVIWFCLAFVAPQLEQLKRLPTNVAAAHQSPLKPGIADLQTFTLLTVRPRFEIVIQALIVIVAVVALFFLPREFDPWRRDLPNPRHPLLFMAITIGIIGYQLIAHAVLFYRLVRSIWLEQHLARRAMRAEGSVTDTTSGVIKYEFLDYANNLRRGEGSDYTSALFEEMPVLVLYDPENPSVNLPIVGLQYHKLIEALDPVRG